MTALRDSRLSLVIVDDDERILELAAHAAGETGLFGSVISVSNGREALAQIIAAEHAPDAVLTDLSMPQIDGFELARTLKSLPQTRHIPIVMFSSSGLHYDQQHALDAGCAAFLQKPSTLAGLVDLLREVARIATQVAAT